MFVIAMKFCSQEISKWSYLIERTRKLVSNLALHVYFFDSGCLGYREYKGYALYASYGTGVAFVKGIEVLFQTTETIRSQYNTGRIFSSTRYRYELL